MIRALMKKVIVLCLFALACRRETPAPTSSPRPATRVPQAANPAPAPAPVATAPHADASYDKAVEWMRSAPAYHFDVTIGDAKASGDLTRERIGAEKLRFRIGNDEWTAERKLTGVAWFRNGKHDTNEPALADRIYQWMTFFPDPQKSGLQVVGSEGDTTHVRFTIVNTKETEDVWIRSDNHLVRLTTSGAGKAFPAMELNIR
jgi:hypothetical protein